MKEITIEIDEDGNSTIAVKGVAGPECLKLTAAIEDVAGTVTKRTKTAEHQARPELQKQAR